jgi:hypothetical protein
LFGRRALGKCEPSAFLKDTESVPGVLRVGSNHTGNPIALYFLNLGGDPVLDDFAAFRANAAQFAVSVLSKKLLRER